MSEERCISCGDIIPEGRQVCPKCEKETILDSGNRRKFDTGAVRDIQEGKGRCDLMPLDVISLIYAKVFGKEDESANVMMSIHKFQESNNVDFLIDALSFVDMGYSSYSNMFLEVSKHFEAGAKKYGEYNWQKGIPVHCYIDSAVRHYLKWLRGDTDEPHDRAFVWNILCCIWEVKHHEMS